MNKGNPTSEFEYTLHYSKHLLGMTSLSTRISGENVGTVLNLSEHVTYQAFWRQEFANSKVGAVTLPPIPAVDTGFLWEVKII